MNYICTWLCADEKGEESIFPQTGQKSSSQSHQNIYWRCLLVFYMTSKRFNKTEQHILYTNVKQLPVVDGRKVSEMLEQLSVQVVFTDFKFKTPKGYFGMFQNQFYEFSILEYIVQHPTNPDDQYLIVDSDCIFLKPATQMFNEASVKGFMSFEDDCTTDLVIHGLSRKNMKALYEDLLSKKLDEIPGYHLGEFFLASVKNITTIFNDFLALWPELLRRHQQNLPKFNEEAHTLSYLYYKNGFEASTSKTVMKRIWTNPLFYRNVNASDADLIIWHLPAEKTFGLADIYEKYVSRSFNYGFSVDDKIFVEDVHKILGVPVLTPAKRLRYFAISYYRAIVKRMKKYKLISKAAF